MAQQYRVTQNYGLTCPIDQFFHYFPVGTIVKRVPDSDFEENDLFGTVYEYHAVHDLEDIAGDWNEAYTLDQYIPDSYLEAI